MNINKIISETVNHYINNIIQEHITIDRIIKKHGDEGFIIISANRSSLSSQENEMNKQNLEQEIKDSGYSYLPTHGGYHNIETGEDGDYEPSFLVLNNQKSMNYDTEDFNNLVELGKQWCAEYDQDCFLVKSPTSAAIYLDRDGNKVNSTETPTVYKNDPTKEFFTTLHSPHEDAENAKHGIIGRRWTHDIEF